MWEAGNIPMKTCWGSSVLVGALDEEGSEGEVHDTGGLRVVQTT